MKKAFARRILAMIIGALILMPFFSVFASAQESTELTELYITNSSPAPKAGDVIVSFFEDFEVSEGLVIDGGLLRKLDADGNEYGWSVGDKYEAGFVYEQVTFIGAKYGYTFKEGITAEDFPDIDGFSKRFEDGMIVYTRRVSFLAEGDNVLKSFQITNSSPAPKAGDVIVSFFEDFEVSEGLVIDGGLLRKLDADGNEYGWSVGDKYEAGFIYEQVTFIGVKYGYTFKEGITAEDFPDIDGFDKRFEDGMIVYTRRVSLISDEYEYKKGDFDFDGKITVADALAALRIAAKMEDETEKSIAIGDIDADSHVTVSDALAILRVAAKLDESL